MTVERQAESGAGALQRRNRELSILNAIAEALNRSIALDQALQVALERVADLLGLQSGWVWLLHEETGEPYLAAALHLPPALASRGDAVSPRMTGTCYCLDTYRAGDLSGAANVNVITCSRLKGLVDGTDGLRYHASIPLTAPGKPLGVLNVAGADWRELSAEDLRLLHTVGDLLSIAIERARLFARSAQTGAVEERNRLAREIHDTLAQGMAAVALQLETAEALLEAGGPERVREAVGRAITLNRANLEEARRSVLDLRAAPLEGRTLAAALEALAAEQAVEQEAHIAFEAVGRPRPLPARIEAGLYRMAQEALNNALRHAQASHITLQLVFSARRIRLIAADDGRGFDPEHVPGGYGLIGLSERAKLLGATLRIASRPGAGTRLEVTLPLQTTDRLS